MELNPNLLGAYESLGEALKLQGINKTTTQVFPNHWQNAGNSRNLLTAENPQNPRFYCHQSHPPRQHLQRW